ncbi:ganglioside gm2 activator [Plakobranchus ocellatus]|uniref:Ganglioside gm2 activator n=1 Tax=Plakobranchus ocellatus TaxID=259542 RepID=A0AAV3YGB3_9GAST|nr:ganglioside gm2 activator [Plakobranchus ocellatus]
MKPFLTAHLSQLPIVDTIALLAICKVNLIEKFAFKTVIRRIRDFKMLLHSFFAALSLMLLPPALEGRFHIQTPDIGKLYRQLQGSKFTESKTVQQMSVNAIDELSSHFLLRGRPIGSQISRSSLGAPFHWESCGPSNQSINIRNLTITPSPLSFPGPLNFGFDIIFQDTISASDKVSANLKLQVNTQGTWYDIPCIGQIGSCTYDDLCSLLQKIQCPADLKKQGISCSCPFYKGEYKLQKYSVQIDASVFLAGDYRAKAVLTDSAKGQIACYQITFTVQ